MRKCLAYDDTHIECTIYGSTVYYVLKEILKAVWLPVGVAVGECWNHARRSTILEDEMYYYLKEFNSNLFTGAENLHGQYEFVTIEACKKPATLLKYWISQEKQLVNTQPFLILSMPYAAER